MGLSGHLCGNFKCCLEIINRICGHLILIATLYVLSRYHMCLISILCLSVCRLINIMFPFKF